MRIPILNINKSDFLQVTQDLLTPAQVDMVFKRACNLKPAVFMYKTTKVQSDKVRKVLRTSNTELFNTLLTNTRLTLGHKFSPIHSFDSAYTLLSEIAADASDFADVHGIEEYEAYLIYINKGLSFMGKSYGLSKFKYYKEKIYNSYDNELTIKGDDDPYTTEAIYKTFCRLYNIRPNVNYWNKVRVDMIKIKQRASEANMKPSKYLNIQADFYTSINKIPEPSYFHTQEAFERTFKNNR